MFHLIAITMDPEGRRDAASVAEEIRCSTGAWSDALRDEISFLHLSVCLDENGTDQLPAEEDGEWRIAVDSQGAILHEAQVREALHGAVMHYVAKAGQNDRRPYRVVGIARSACAAALTLFPFARWLHDEIERLQPLTMDLFLLQPQAEVGDVHSGAVLARVAEVNLGGWFRHVYLMPWDDEARRAQSREAIVASCRVSLRIEATGKANHPMLVETLSSRQLLPPAWYIRECVLRLMARSFVRMLEEDGNSIGQLDFSGGAGAQQDERAEFIREALRQLYEKHRPASVARLHAVMPLRDPDLRASGELSLAQLYDERAVSELRRMTSVDARAIYDDFEAEQAPIAEHMIRMVVAAGARRSLRIGDLNAPNSPLLAPGRFLPPPARQGAEERWSGSPLTRRATAIARERHRLIMGLYRPARDDSEKKCREAMTRAVELGEVSCRAFLGEVRDRFLARLSQMASAESWINDERYYVGRVEEAYGHWWSENREPAMSFDAFYKMLDESLDVGDAAQTADALYDRVAERLNQRVDEILRPIRSRIEQFFEELALRSELLRRKGAPGDLFEDLSRELTGGASHRLLLLVRAGAGDLVPVRSVYIVPVGEAVDKFCKLAEQDSHNTVVLRDAAEPGVVLLVEYGGDVLDRLAFAQL